MKRLDIHSIHIDFDKNVLEINGEPYKKETIVILPEKDGWTRKKLFFSDKPVSKEKCDCLEVRYISAVNSKL